MDLDYFKSQITDELDGAKQYIKYAIEIKPMNKEWAKMFLEMGIAEMSHATNLHKMFEEYVVALKNDYKELPEYIKKMQTEVNDEFTEKMAIVKYIQSMYSA